MIQLFRRIKQRNCEHILSKVGESNGMLVVYCPICKLNKDVSEEEFEIMLKISEANRALFRARHGSDDI